MHGPNAPDTPRGLHQASTRAAARSRASQPLRCSPPTRQKCATYHGVDAPGESERQEERVGLVEGQRHARKAHNLRVRARVSQC